VSRIAHVRTALARQGPICADPARQSVVIAGCDDAVGWSLLTLVVGISARPPARRMA
jgi:hypothetical protein